MDLEVTCRGPGIARKKKGHYSAHFQTLIEDIGEVFKDPDQTREVYSVCKGDAVSRTNMQTGKDIAQGWARLKIKKTNKQTNGIKQCFAEVIECPKEERTKQYVLTFVFAPGLTYNLNGETICSKGG